MIRSVSTRSKKKDAASHGLQRWHQGYRLREVTREWGHLQLVLLDELERYASARMHMRRRRCQSRGAC